MSGIKPRIIGHKNSALKRQSTVANTRLTQILELSDNFKAAVTKLLQ
jgi:hypothetical protein